MTVPSLHRSRAESSCKGVAPSKASSWIGRWIVSALIVAATTIPVWLGLRASIPSEAIVTDASRLDFGRVWAQGDFHWRLPIENTSNQPIEITEFVTSCNCSSITPSSLWLPPNGRAEIDIALDLFRRTPRDAGGVRDFAVDIVPRFRSAVAKPVVWRVQGQIRDLFQFSPSRVTFHETDRLVAGRDFTAKVLVATSALALSELRASCFPESSGMVRVVAKDNEQRRFELSIIPACNLPVGPFEFRVLLTPIRAGNEGSLPEVPLPVTGVVLSEYRSYPDRISFGALRLQDTAEQTLVLRSRRGRDFTIADVTTSSSDVTVVEAAAEGKGRPNYRIAQRATALGDAVSEVTFRIRGDVTTTVSVPVHYYGVLPDATEQSLRDYGPR